MRKVFYKNNFCQSIALCFLFVVDRQNNRIRNLACPHLSLPFCQNKHKVVLQFAKSREVTSPLKWVYKTMYALTRHETPENVRLCNAKDFCGPNAKYRGSHDAFLLRLLAPLPSQLLDSIDYRPNLLGIEQVLIFNFHKHAQFNTKNPCKILHIVHHHCSKLRNSKERKIPSRQTN